MIDQPANAKDSSVDRACPVCGVSDVKQTRHEVDLTAHLNGSLYVLMCPRCKTEFLREPERYTVGRQKKR